MSAVPDIDPALTAALEYAARGWRVVPIKAGGKHPPMKAWQDNATNDPDTIRALWRGLYRGCGVGVATGASSGVWVLDVDDWDVLVALESEHGPIPPTYTVDENGQRLHSWRTLILPYLGQEELFERLDLSKPWNHPVNAEVFNAKLNAFWCPSSELPSDFTTYLAVVGENACFHPTKPRAISEITDGTSNTIMVIEVPVKQAVHWMSPHDADDQMVLNIGPADKRAHTGGVQAAVADGSVRFLSATMDPETRRAVISINGKEVIGEW